MQDSFLFMIYFKDSHGNKVVEDLLIPANAMFPEDVTGGYLDWDGTVTIERVEKVEGPGVVWNRYPAQRKLHVKKPAETWQEAMLNYIIGNRDRDAVLEAWGCRDDNGLLMRFIKEKPERVQSYIEQLERDKQSYADYLEDLEQNPEHYKN